MTRRLGLTAAVVATLAAVAVGCGGTRSADNVLRDTARHMRDIHSARLDMRLLMEPRQGDRGRVGFALSGPIELRAGRLPVARLRYTQYAGSRHATATLTSTGRAVYAEMNGRVTQLPPAQAEALRGAGQVGGGSGDMPVGSWIRKAHTAAGGTVGGVKTDRVVATLDAGAALRDIFTAVRAAGNRAPRIDADAERELRRSVDESRLELWSGADDKLLRRLWVRIGFKADVPQGLRRSLGELVGGRLRFDIDLSELNRPVKVTAPPGQPS